MKYQAKGMRRDRALEIASLSKHQYYHQSSCGKNRGRPKTTHTLKKVSSAKISVNDNDVIAEMIGIDSDPDLRCGARRMTFQLHLLGYVINRKKVARLMKENGLTKKGRKQAKKTYARYRIVTPIEPLVVLEMDIKQVWIVRDRRSAYILTVLDTFTRETLAWIVSFSITSREVKLIWNYIIIDHLEPAGMASRAIRVEIRNDGGPQFAAKIVQEYFDHNGLHQVFTHPYTPQENGHIESFHSILSASIDREYLDIVELENRLHRFYYMYNHKRTHTGTMGLPPAIFKRAWENDLVMTCYDGIKKVKMKLRAPIYEIPGILSQREHLATKKNRAKRTIKNNIGGEKTSSANHAATPVYPSSSVASCDVKKSEIFVLI